MLKEIPKVGEEIRYLGGDGDDVNDLTIGRVYEIAGEEGEDIPYITDDGGEQWLIDDCNNDNLEYYEIVEEAEQQPDVSGLIANLGRRVHELEGADAVNSPAHYKRGKFETIEVIEEITAGYSDGFVAHCAGTAIKYIARAPYKHATPTEDLRKAAKYLEFAIKRLEAEASE